MNKLHIKRMLFCVLVVLIAVLGLMASARTVHAECLPHQCGDINDPGLTCPVGWFCDPAKCCNRPPADPPVPTPPPSCSSNLSAGYHNGYSGAQLQAGCFAAGWAVDWNDTANPTQIRISSDGNVVYQGQTSLDVDGVSSNSGFNVSLWSLISHNADHSIKVEGRNHCSGGWASLTNTPRTINCQSDLTCSLSFSPASPQSDSTTVSIYPNATSNDGVTKVDTYVNQDASGGEWSPSQDSPPKNSWELIGSSITGNVSWTTSNSSHTVGTHWAVCNAYDTSGKLFQGRAQYTLTTPVPPTETPVPPTPTPACLTAAPTNLAPTALTCENTVLRTYNWDAVPGASGYQFQLYVTSEGVDYWCTNDGNVGTNSYTVSSCANSADTKTGTVTWKVLAKYPNSCADSSFTTGAAYSVDKSASNVPTGLSLTCHLNGSVDALWNAAADIGCKGLHSTPYWAQVSTDSNFATAINTAPWLNAWTSGTTKSTAAGAFSTGDVVYGHVRSRDGFDQQSVWNPAPPVSCTISTPQPPTAVCKEADFNSDGHAKTPIIWSWTDGAAGLQSKDNSFSLPGYWWYNASAISPLTINGIRPGPPDVCARTVDGWYGGNWHSFSSESCITCPLPTNKTTVISGVLRQKSGTGCNQADASNNFNISTLTGTTGDSCVTIKTPCTFSLDKQHAASYSCTVTWDNQACVAEGRQPNTAQTLMINAATSDSTGQLSNASCDLNGTSLSINAGVNNPNADITFPVANEKWVKIKDTSFNASSTISNNIPVIVSKFTPSDSDDDGSKYFIMSSAGVALRTTSNAYSAANWYDSSYPSYSLPMSPSIFFSYVKSRKEYKTISDLSSTSIDKDGIYVWDGTVAFPDITDATSIPDKNFVLISTVKPITISRTNFNPAKSVAIVANNITFGDTTQTANGIFIAQTVNTGSNSNLGLKIKGNLIAQSQSPPFTNGRSWSDTSRPGLFIVFDPIQYINLLPYLSTASYDWRQIQ